MPLAPEYQAMLAELKETPGPAFTDLTPEQGREMYRLMRPANPELTVAAVLDRSIEAASDSSSASSGASSSASGDPIPIRIYTPAGDGPFPVYVNYHGGGWVIGDLDTADAACRDLCNTAGCVVVSVDYRMAPEHLYPAAVDDCYTAVCWAADNMGEINGNGKLAVGGESAGGTLAAVVCLKARDENGPRIDFQLLAYPVTDCDFTRQSYQDNGEGYILDTATMGWFWDYYCPDVEMRKEPHASPIRADDLSNLPPALVVTAEFDPLRDEGMAYAAALSAAGNSAEGICYDGLVHDFFATAQVFKASRPGFEHACQALQAAFSKES
jgi:acetyl esterase